MTTIELPPLPAVPLPNGYPVEQHGIIAKFAQDYARLAIEQDRRDARLAAEAEAAALRKEIEILRHYGNKDCTAMADVALDAEKKEALNSALAAKESK